MNEIDAWCRKNLLQIRKDARYPKNLLQIIRDARYPRKLMHGTLETLVVIKQDHSILLVYRVTV